VFTHDVLNQKQVSTYSIPHITSFTFGDKGGKVHVLFPQLYSPDGPRENVSRERIAQWYNAVMGPAMADAAHEGHDTTYLPPNYMSEVFRLSSSRTGRFSASGRAIQPRHLDRLVEIMRARVKDDPDLQWATGFCFMVEIYGSKLYTRYALGDAAGWYRGWEALITSTLKTGPNKLHPIAGDWWVDVALEFHHPEKSVLWKKEGHGRLLQWVLGMEGSEVRKVLRTIGENGKYRLDHHCQLQFVAGCRFWVGTTKTADNAVYFQAYTTDKTLLGRREGRHFNKYLDPKEILLDGKYKSADDFKQRYISKVWGSLVTAQHRPINARVEVRVPLEKAHGVLTGRPVSETLMSEMLTVQETQHMW
jgi:hypothetical protein